MSTEYSIDNARRALPYLLECARNRTTITYGDLAALIGRHHRAVPHLLEYLLRYCEHRQLPYIGTLVVNASTRKPGDGFLPDQAARQLSEEVFDAEARRIVNEVYEYPHWIRVLEDMR